MINLIPICRIIWKRSIIPFVCKSSPAQLSVNSRWQFTILSPKPEESFLTWWLSVIQCYQVNALVVPYGLNVALFHFFLFLFFFLFLAQHYRTFELACIRASILFLFYSTFIFEFNDLMYSNVKTTNLVLFLPRHPIAAVSHAVHLHLFHCCFV